MRQGDVCDVYAPDVIRPAARQVSQQVRVHRMITVRTARIGLWPDDNQAHLLHLALNAFATNEHSIAAYLPAASARAIERMRCKQLINRPLQGKLFRGRCGRLARETVSNSACAESGTSWEPRSKKASRSSLFRVEARFFLSQASWAVSLPICS